ncbi:MAG: T9SS type A sorting domain-containing protein [Bacteroidota bacterium]
MKQKKGKGRKSKAIGIAALFNIALFLSTASAQNTIPTTGGNATGSGGSVSYSVGQVVYTTNVGTTGSVAQGVQQPYEISIVIGLEEAKEINLLVSAYPNPTKEFLNLKVENYTVENLSYQLFDIQGKLLESKKIESKETSIVTSNLVPATYFLRVIESNREIKTFKIIKN